MSNIKTTAHQKHIRQSPLKLRMIANTIRGLSVDQALEQLEFTPKKAARIIKKVIVQAQANAVNNLKASPASLVVDEIQISEGSRLKRWRAVSRGRAHSIIKRMSHVRVSVTGKTEENTKG